MKPIAERTVATPTARYSAAITDDSALRTRAKNVPITEAMIEMAPIESG